MINLNTKLPLLSSAVTSVTYVYILSISSVNIIKLKMISKYLFNLMKRFNWKNPFKCFFLSSLTYLYMVIISSVNKKIIKLKMIYKYLFKLIIRLSGKNIEFSGYG